MDIARAHMRIAKAKVRQQDLDAAMVNTRVEVKIANMAFHDAKRKQNIAWWQKTPNNFDRAQEDTRKALTDLEAAKEAALAIHAEMDTVKAQITTAKAKLAAAERAQSKADEQWNQFIQSESRNKMRQARTEIQQTINGHLKGTGHLNSSSGDFWEMYSSSGSLLRGE